MTSEIERKFFEAFGIKHKCCNNQESTCPAKDCNSCTYNAEPTITDRILLELICILSPYAPAVGDNVESLKEHILHYCAEYKDKIYNEVRTLFNLKEQQ